MAATPAASAGLTVTVDVSSGVRRVQRTPQNIVARVEVASGVRTATFKSFAVDEVTWSSERGAGGGTDMASSPSCTGQKYVVRSRGERVSRSMDDMLVSRSSRQRTNGVARRHSFAASLPRTVGPFNSPGGWDIFISHSPFCDQGALVGRQLCAAFEEKGCSVWLGTAMKDSSVLATREGAMHSSLFLALMVGATSYFDCDQSIEELLWARQFGVPVQPIVDAANMGRLKEILATLPSRCEFLAHMEWISVEEISKRSVDQVGTNAVLQKLAHEQEKKLNAAKARVRALGRTLSNEEEQSLVLLYTLSGAVLDADRVSLVRQQYALCNEPALLSAVRSGHIEDAAILLVAGDDVRVTDMHGATALHYAANRLGHFEMLRILLIAPHGMELLDMRRDDGITALMYAAHQNHIDIVRYLVRLGAATDLRDDHGRTALHLAARHTNNPDLIRALVSGLRGMDVLNAFHDGWTPLMNAAEQNNVHAFKALIEGGADLSLKNHMGYTAHAIAVERGNKECVEICRTYERGVTWSRRVKEKLTKQNGGCQIA